VNVGLGAGDERCMTTHRQNHLLLLLVIISTFSFACDAGAGRGAPDALATPDSDTAAEASTTMPDAPATGDAASADAASDARDPDAADAPLSSAEDCSTDEDDDGNGYGGCADPACWDEERCIEEELLALVDPTGGAGAETRCGETVYLDAAATAERCREGMPFGFTDGDEEFDCGAGDVTATLETFCQPGGTVRALRYRISMDTSDHTEMLGPDLWRSTSYEPDPDFCFLAWQEGAGGHGGAAPPPHREARLVDDTYRSVRWFVAERGAQMVFLQGAHRDEVIISVLADGGAAATTSRSSTSFVAGIDVWIE